MAGVSFFGRNLPRALTVATRKFTDCPWPHFDGFLDSWPNRILAGDFAVTHVMNSGIRMKQAWWAVERGEHASVRSALERIPVDLRLEDTVETPDLVDWKAIDSLFQRLSTNRMRLSRIAKMLCRKRSALIPMLDGVVVKFLKDVAWDWHRGRNDPPSWFDDKLWDQWSWQVPSPYIRMIRHDIRGQIPQLKRLRARLHANRDTEVPSDASLLRIYEATLWAALMKGLI